MLSGVVWPCAYTSVTAKTWYVGGAPHSMSTFSERTYSYRARGGTLRPHFIWLHLDERHPLALVFQAYLSDGSVRASERSAILSGTERLHERAAVGLATYQVRARQRFHLVCELGVGLIVET